LRFDNCDNYNLYIKKNIDLLIDWSERMELTNRRLVTGTATSHGPQPPAPWFPAALLSLLSIDYMNGRHLRSAEEVLYNVSGLQNLEGLVLQNYFSFRRWFDFGLLFFPRGTYDPSRLQKLGCFFLEWFVFADGFVGDKGVTDSHHVEALDGRP